MVKAMKTTLKLDYSNHTFFFFHSHFNFRLNQLNKDQNHQKDFNNIRHPDKKLTQNEVSTTNVVHFGLKFYVFFPLCVCIFSLPIRKKKKQNTIDFSVVVWDTYTSSLCKQFPTEWSLTFIQPTECIFQWKKKSGTYTHTH